MAADALRLQACLWTDQPHWLDLTRAAMAVASAPVICADAIDGLTPLLDQGRRSDCDRRNTACMAEDQSGRKRRPGAALTLRLWPGDTIVQLGRIDFHGRGIDWTGSD